MIRTFLVLLVLFVHKIPRQHKIFLWIEEREDLRLNLFIFFSFIFFLTRCSCTRLIYIMYLQTRVSTVQICELYICITPHRF